MCMACMAATPRNECFGCLTFTNTHTGKRYRFAFIHYTKSQGNVCKLHKSRGKLTQKPPKIWFSPKTTASRGAADEHKPSHQPLANQTLRLVWEENPQYFANRSYASQGPKGTCESPSACSEARNRAREGRPMGSNGEEKNIFSSRLRNCA